MKKADPLPLLPIAQGVASFLFFAGTCGFSFPNKDDSDASNPYCTVLSIASICFGLACAGFARMAVTAYRKNR